MYACAITATVSWLSSVWFALATDGPPMGWPSWPIWVGWAVWALVGLGLASLWRHVILWHVEMRALRRWAATVDQPGFQPIGPDVPGPAGVKIVDPDGGEIPLTVKPHVRLPTGGTVWYAYGPAGTKLPEWGELHIQVMPPQSSILVRTVEDEEGQVWFIGPDGADVTLPNPPE